MLNQIKALLQDNRLRQQIKAAKTLEEAIALLKSSDTKISGNDLRSMFARSSSSLEVLSETDLLGIAGGRLTTKCSSGCPDTD